MNKQKWSRQCVEQGNENLCLKLQDCPELRPPFFLLPPRPTGNRNTLQKNQDIPLHPPKSKQIPPSTKNVNTRGNKWAIFISHMSYYTPSPTSWWYKTCFTDITRNNFWTAHLKKKKPTPSLWDTRLCLSSKPLGKIHQRSTFTIF